MKLVARSTVRSYSRRKKQSGNDFFTHRSYTRVNPKLLEDVRAKGDTLWLFNYHWVRAIWALAIAKVDAQAYSAWAYQWRAAKNPYDPFADGRHPKGVGRAQVSSAGLLFDAELA